MGKHICAFLHRLTIQNRELDPNKPRQIFYDREEIRMAMGVQSEEQFIDGLIWAEKQGWITGQHDYRQ